MLHVSSIHYVIEPKLPEGMLPVQLSTLASELNKITSFNSTCKTNLDFHFIFVCFSVSPKHLRLQKAYVSISPYRSRFFT